MGSDKFCSIEEVRNLFQRCNGQPLDPLYFNATMEMFRKNVETSNDYFIDEGGMNLQSFLVFTSLLTKWYKISSTDIADFIDQKYKDKYAITKEDVLGIISKAVEVKAIDDQIGKPEPIKETSADIPLRRRAGRPRKISAEIDPNTEADMYRIVQRCLKNGMSKAAIQKKYKLTQGDMTKYEGYEYWTDSQREEHKAMLEYRRLHLDCSGKEAIEKGAGKSASGYRFSLVPTKEQQEAYNCKIALISSAKQQPTKPAPKAKIKGNDVKSLILSDEERKEQEALYSKIKEIAEARNTSSRDITSLLKSRLVRDYGIVIEQIKKDLMIKFRVNRGEGKAPNTLEAIVMSEYLPIAQSILDDMLTESYAVK